MASQRFRVLVADTEYYRQQIACQNACPAHTDVAGYLSAIARGDFEQGYIIARQPNPFASICGRVCSSPCERACRRGKIDAPVAIRTLKRFLCEGYGAEAWSHLPLRKETERKAGIACLNDQPPLNARTAESFSQLSARRKGTATAGSVAVIGAGPVGLSAAHDLALLGHRVTIFEAASDAGGMALLGIPEYRLPRDVLKMEISEILDLGVKLELNKRLGVDFSLATLREGGYDAILIAIGAYKDRWLDIEGTGLNGVLAAIDFLTYAKQGRRISLGEKVVVVGGGGPGDASRTSRTKGTEDGFVDNTLMTVMDAARQALRHGAREVHVCYRGTREELRATQAQEEVDSALEEGVMIHTELIPKRILGSDSKVSGLETLTCRSQQNQKGEPETMPVPGSESTIACTSVILAIGQESDLSFIRPEDGVLFSGQGAIIVERESLSTSAPGIFAGGDAVRGPRTVIDAVADGHRAARAIDDYLTGEKAIKVTRGWFLPVAPEDLPAQDSKSTHRINPPKIPLDQRSRVSEVEGVYDAASAIEQAQRCLKCHIQTIFNASLCTLCGACVDVCPQGCLKMVGLDKIEGDAKLEAIVEAPFGVSLETLRENAEARELGTAMLKDESLCDRCGLCAKRCPTGALTMQAFQFEEELVYEKRRDKDWGELPELSGKPSGYRAVEPQRLPSY